MRFKVKNKKVRLQKNPSQVKLQEEPPQVQRLTRSTLEKAIQDNDHKIIRECLENGVSAQGCDFSKNIREGLSLFYKTLLLNHKIGLPMLKGKIDPKEVHEVKFMPRKGCKDRESSNFCSLTDLAIINNEVEIFEALLKKGADKHSHFNAWYLAIHFGANTIMEYLLKNELFLNHMDIDGIPIINEKPLMHLILESLPLKPNKKYFLLIESLLRHAPGLVSSKDYQGQSFEEAIKKRETSSQELYYLVRFFSLAGECGSIMGAIDKIKEHSSIETQVEILQKLYGQLLLLKKEIEVISENKFFRVNDKRYQLASLRNEIQRLCDSGSTMLDQAEMLSYLRKIDKINQADRRKAPSLKYMRTLIIEIAEKIPAHLKMELSSQVALLKEVGNLIDNYVVDLNQFAQKNDFSADARDDGYIKTPTLHSF